MTSYLVMAAVSVVAVIVVISGSTETHAYLYPPPFPPTPPLPPLGLFFPLFTCLRSIRVVHF